MQILLQHYKLFVIAQVNDITPHIVPADSQQPSAENMGLAPGETFFKCKVEKVEHVVNFTN